MKTAKTSAAARFYLAAVFSVSALCSFCAEDKIWDDRPGDKWENSWYPLGNGRLGCMVDGGARKLRIQFNVDSLWTGDKNLTNDIGDNRADANYNTMGAYQNFGELEIELGGLPEGESVGYRRELDIARAVYSDRFQIGDAKISRQAFASAPSDCIVIVVRSEGKPLDLVLRLKGAHGEPDSATAVDAPPACVSGRLPNGLAYAACAQLFYPSKMQAEIILRAATGTESLGKFRRGNAAAMLDRSVADYRKYYDRMTFDLGKGDETVPTRVRLDRVRKGAKDPALIALMFNFGRYLLISCSRPGTLPANLQGIWNNSNNPPWHCDYHTNINIQMNYWGADSANLSDCFTPLSDWMMNSLPVAEAGTRAAFPNSKGYAYRTSANAVGGGGWRWNFAGAPWMAAQCYDHYLFTRDRKYLKEVCWPLMKGAAEFIISTHLKERPDGTIVVKDGWSPEHGPREDGVAHEAPQGQDRQLGPASGMGDRSRQEGRPASPHEPPLRRISRFDDFSQVDARARRGSQGGACRPHAHGRFAPQLDLAVACSALGAPWRGRQGGRDARLLAPLQHPRQYVCDPPAVPDRRQPRNGRGRVRDAA